MHLHSDIREVVMFAISTVVGHIRTEAPPTEHSATSFLQVHIIIATLSIYVSNLNLL